MGSTIVNPASGKVPQLGSDPLAPANNAVAYLNYDAVGPVRMDVLIQGLGGVGNYTAPAVAVIEHFDPFSNAIVRDFQIIGGNTGATTISFVTGGLPGEHATGDVSIALYNLAGNPLWTVPVGIVAQFGLYDKLTQTTANGSFLVTGIGGSPIAPLDTTYVSSLSQI